MVGYMQGSKRARNTPSIANKTSVFGIMGGLAPRTGTSNVSVYRHQQIKGSRGLPQLYGKSVDYQKNYLKTNKLLSVNPLGSGGVGKKTSMFHQSCNCSQNIPMSGLLGINRNSVVTSSFNEQWVNFNSNTVSSSEPNQSQLQSMLNSIPYSYLTLDENEELKAIIIDLLINRDDHSKFVELYNLIQMINNEHGQKPG